MVRIPQPEPQGQPVGSIGTVPANTPTFNVRPADTSQPGRDLQSLGQSLNNVAVELQERTNDTAMREAELAYMGFEREVLDPQNGILARRQGSALGATAEVTSRFQEVREDVLSTYGERVSRSGRQALEQYLDGAEQRMWKRVASHELSEARAHEESLILGQMEAQMDRASLLYTDGAEVAAAELQVGALAGDLADARGLTGQAREQFIEDQTTALHGQVASQMAASSPARAVEYVETMLQQGKMDPTEANRMLTELRPAAIEERGTALARGVIAAGQNPGAEALLSLIDAREGAGQYDTLFGHRQDGEFSGVDVSSMTVDEAIAFADPSGPYGQSVKSELGYVATPMGRFQIVGSTLRHLKQVMDLEGDEKFDASMQHQMFETLVEGALMNAATPAQKRAALRGVWEGFVGVPDEQLDTAIAAYEAGETTVTPRERVAQEEDPEVRSVAMAELERMEADQRERTKRQREDLRNALFADIDEAIAAGQDYDLNTVLNQPGVRTLLGDDVKAVRDYWQARGEPETDMETYRSLQIASETNPDEFASMDLTVHRGELSPSVYKGFVDKQARILGDAERQGRADRVSLTEIRSNIGGVLSGREPEDRGFIERSMEQYVLTYTEMTGSPPDAMMQYRHADRLAAELDGRTQILAEYDAPFGQPNTTLDQLRHADQNPLENLIERTDIAFNITLPGGRVEEVEVTPDEMRDFALNYEIATGRPPRPSQVIQMLYLIKSGILQ